uniref:Uncharacterized protein n=1 Tax=Ascaris lumbricoides TaxID=6252 RepID=A0A0M3HSY9_ASCLU
METTFRTNLNTSRLLRSHLTRHGMGTCISGTHVVEEKVTAVCIPQCVIAFPFYLRCIFRIDKVSFIGEQMTNNILPISRVRNKKMRREEECLNCIREAAIRTV